MPAKDKGTPLPLKLEEARREGSIETDIMWIKQALEAGHPCHNEQRISALEKGRNVSRGIAVAAILCAVGLTSTVLINCQEQTERNATTQVLVQTNAEHIRDLKSSVSEINKSRLEDLRSIRTAIKANGKSEDNGIDCAKLDARTKRMLARQLGDESPCE